MYDNFQEFRDILCDIVTCTTSRYIDDLKHVYHKVGLNDVLYVPISINSTSIEHIVTVDHNIVNSIFYFELNTSHVNGYSSNNKISTISFKRKKDYIHYGLQRDINDKKVQLGNVPYYVRFGRIIHHPFIDTPPELLLNLAFRKQYITRSIIEPEHLVLFVSNKFRYDKLYKSLWAEVNKEYILPLEKLNIDIIYTNDVIGKCYPKLEYATPKFKTISELDAYFTSIKSALM